MLLTRYIEITGQTRQNVIYKIENGKLQSRKDDSGRVYILLDIDPKEIGVSKEDDHSRIESVLGSVIMEYKNDLLAFKEEMKNYTEKIELANQKIIELKDQQIKEQKEEINQ